jgi:hypothetical protein
MAPTPLRGLRIVRSVFGPIDGIASKAASAVNDAYGGVAAASNCGRHC